MPLLHLPPSHPRVFYSLAATLIPIFLFGGTFVARLSDPPRGVSHRSLLWRGGLIPIFGAIAITAEAMAINAAVAGDAGRLQRGFIVFALISGLTVSIMGIWIPWISRIRSSRLPAHAKHAVLILPAAILLLAAYSVVSDMNDTVSYAGTAEDQVALRIAIDRRAAEIRDADRRLDAYTYRIGRLKERLLVAIERRERYVRRAVAVEIKTQEELQELEKQHLGEIIHKGREEIAETRPDF